MPVKAVNGFGGNNFAQRLGCKRGLGARTTIIVAAQADGLLRWREAMDRAGREGDYDFTHFGGRAADAAR